jgi:spore germination protein YaaH
VAWGNGPRKGLELLLVACISVGAALHAAPAVAAPSTQGTSSPRPHADQDAAHSRQTYHFTPAHSAPTPRVIDPSRAAAVAGPVLRRQVLGFAPYWQLSQEASWHYDLLSTVAYFGLDVKADGSFDTTTPGWSGWNSQQLVDMVNAAHQSGDRVVLVIKQFDDATINAIVTTPAARQAAVQNTVNAIAAKDLDGVNVDFEGTATGYPGVQSGMTTFVTQLTAAVHGWRAGTEVSVDTYGSSAASDTGIFKVGDLARAADAIFVMAYDLVFGDLCCQAGPNAPLRPYPPYNDTDIVTQYLAKVPPGQLLLGVPYYGYKWTTTNNQPNAPVKGGSNSVRTSDPYSGVIADIGCVQNNGQQLGQAWDVAGASPYATWLSPVSADPCAGNFGSWRQLYYDNAQSLGFKYDLVNSRNLRGTGIWALGFDGSLPELWDELALKFGAGLGFDRLGGSLTSSADAASWAANRMDVFGRGMDGQLWHSWWDGTGWSGWEPLGGQLMAGTGPGAVSWGNNRLDLFVQGLDAQIWHNWWDGRSWGGWKPLGGRFTSGPDAASWSANHLDVFGRGGDGQLWHSAWTGSGWTPWEPLGGALVGDPGAASWGPNRIDVFVQGTDQQLYHRAWAGAGWGGWESMAGRLGSGPDVTSQGSGRLDVAVLGVSADLWHLAYNGVWSGWRPRGGQGTSDPTIISRTPGVLDAFVRGSDNQLWHGSIPP